VSAETAPGKHAYAHAQMHTRAQSLNGEIVVVLTHHPLTHHPLTHHPLLIILCACRYRGSTRQCQYRLLWECFLARFSPMQGASRPLVPAPAPLSLRLPCLAWTRLDRRNDGRYPCRSCRQCRSSVSSRTPSTFGSAPTSSVPTTTSAGPASSISLVSASPSPHCRALAPVPQPCGCACLEAGQGAAVDLARDAMPSGACFGIGCTTKASLKGSAENPDKSVPAPFHPAVPPCSPPFPIEASKGGRPEPYAGRIIRHTTSNTSDAPAPGFQASD